MVRCKQLGVFCTTETMKVTNWGQSRDHSLLTWHLDMMKTWQKAWSSWISFGFLYCVSMLFLDAIKTHPWQPREHQALHASSSAYSSKKYLFTHHIHGLLLNGWVWQPHGSKNEPQIKSSSKLCGSSTPCKYFTFSWSLLIISVSLRPLTSSSWTHISTVFWNSARRWQLRAMILAMAPHSRSLRRKWLYHVWESFPKSAVERHPQFPEPRMATWQPIIGTELWQHDTDVSGRFWIWSVNMCESNFIDAIWCKMSILFIE